MTEAGLTKFTYGNLDLTMEDEKLPPYVQYHANDASVTSVHGEAASLKTPPKRAWKSRCTAMELLKVAVAVLLITTVTSLTLFFIQRGQARGLGIGAAKLKVPVLVDAPAEGAAPSRVRRATVPEGRESPNSLLGSLLGALDLGTTSVPERRKGVAEPGEPKSITMVAKSPSMTRLLWEPPTCIHGLVDVYNVKVCEMFSECDQKQNLSDCIEHEVSDTWLDFDSTEDTPYCVLITASARCGGKVLTSLPAMQEVRTPLFSLPDLSNLRLISAKSCHITLSWQQPKGRFDYYSVEVTEDKLSSTHTAKHWLGVCANGTIIRPDQTELTCGPLEPCSNISCTMRTHLSGPPERSSPGVTLTDIFIPAGDPNPPTNLTIFPESPSRTRLQWEQPEKVSGIMESYNLQICSTFESCDRAEGLSNCAEYLTTETWTAFDSSVDTSYCVLVTVKARCSFDEVSSRPLIAEIRTPLFDLPDATNLRLLSAAENCITVAWERPQARFDYYSLSIVDDENEGHGDAQNELVGSCGNGTIIHPNQTWATCPNLEACTKVSITLRTHRNGPPERTSRGVSLQGIFIPGEDPDPPKNITMVGKSPSLTRLQWEASAKVDGRLLVYTVKICDTFKSCSGEANMQGCIELQAQETWLDFDSRVDTKYCVLVTTSAQCGDQVLNGRAAVAEIRTPVPVLPDVTNLNLKAVDNHYITVAWDPPRGTFDFYWLDVTNENDNEKGSLQKHNVGSCGKGTIIRAEETQVTCGPFEPCSNISVTVGTSIKGPPARSSTGTTLKGVLLSGQDPSEPKNIIFVAKSPSMARLQWEPPTRIHGILDVYKVKVCKEYTVCDRKESPGGCIENSSSDDWLDFETTADTSYCVVITASARCGVDVLTSLPATLEVRTPSFDPPDVTKLTLLSTGDNYITVAWERPKASFDYYWVSVTDDRGEKHPNAGSCPIGTIIRRDQTQVTCTGLESCSNVTISIGTHRNGPPERTSIGVALQHIFVPGKDCQQNLCYKWVAWRGNTVPENAVPGGQDKAGTLYVCRAKHEGLFIPGKFASWQSTCYVPYNRGEQSYKDFERTPVKCVPVSHGSQPSGFIQVDSTMAGERLYIGCTVAS
ncbi:hypothetical protein HPB49_011571 [Dermacentor silvarum]|uniref:Uncharacterized protein n=1 Tax=Dermacentor silvarum TaxID=543639 RepID=A0ACB8C3B7_DERSI|nr:hypothetical protein HPB49_011571 [Dermacentor silvarum]